MKLFNALLLNKNVQTSILDEGLVFYVPLEGNFEEKFGRTFQTFQNENFPTFQEKNGMAFPKFSNNTIYTTEQKEIPIGNNDFSLSFNLYRASNYYGAGLILEFGSPTGTRTSLYVILQSTTSIKVGFYGDGSNQVTNLNYYKIDGSNHSLNNMALNVILTYSANNTTFDLYVNGKFQKSTRLYQPLNLGWQSLSIGGNRVGTEEIFESSSINNIRIYNKVIDEETISAIYENDFASKVKYTLDFSPNEINLYPNTKQNRIDFSFTPNVSQYFTEIEDFEIIESTSPVKATYTVEKHPKDRYIIIAGQTEFDANMNTGGFTLYVTPKGKSLDETPKQVRINTIYSTEITQSSNQQQINVYTTQNSEVKIEYETNDIAGFNYRIIEGTLRDGLSLEVRGTEIYLVSNITDGNDFPTETCKIEISSAYCKNPIQKELIITGYGESSLKDMDCTLFCDADESYIDSVNNIFTPVIGPQLNIYGDVSIDTLNNIKGITFPGGQNIIYKSGYDFWEPNPTSNYPEVTLSFYFYLHKYASELHPSFTHQYFIGLGGEYSNLTQGGGIWIGEKNKQLIFEFEKHYQTNIKSIDLNTWYHFAIVVKPATYNVDCYLNGQLYSMQNRTYRVLKEKFFGLNTRSYTNHPGGMTDEVFNTGDVIVSKYGSNISFAKIRLYNKVKSQDDILMLSQELTI